MAYLEVLPRPDRFGADIVGLDLHNRPHDVEAAELDRLIDIHGVLVIRGQALDHASLVGFSRRFGEVVVHQVAEYLAADHPEVMILSNNVEGGRPVGAPNNGIFWHSDQIFRRRPVAYTLLYGHEVPPEGGDTLFADMRAVHDDLPAALRDELAGRRAMHSFAVSYQKNYIAAAPLTPERRAANPDIGHPVLRTHPRTGRRAVFVDPDSTSHILDMDPQRSAALLDLLFATLEQPNYVYRHRWRQGDLVIWDNRCLMHRATGYDNSTHRRVMWRTQVAGDEPF